MRTILPFLLLASALLSTLLAARAAAEDPAPLVERLAAQDALTRFEAARALGAQGSEATAALPALLRTLKDPEAWVRLEAGRAIVRIGAREQDIPALVERIEYGDLETAQVAGEALAGLGAAAVPALEKKLESSEPRVRRHALAALTLLGRHAAAAVPRMIDLVVDPDAATRQKAGEALRRCGPWAAGFVADIADRVEFGEPQARWVAATVLASLGPAAKEAIPALQRLLETDNKRLQQVAVHALKRIDIKPPVRKHAGLRDPAQAAGRAPDRFRVRFETTKGSFTVEFERAWSPHGADRAFNLARIGFFDDTAFYRVVDGFVAQFGLNGDSRVNTVWKDKTIPDDPPRQSNTRGTVTFAKLGENSRATQLFVNLGNNAALDADGFAPVGRVVDGMKVVASLHAGYGDGPPRGEGPDQRTIATMGNEYLKRQFPQLDWIKRAVIEE